MSSVAKWGWEILGLGVQLGGDLRRSATVFFLQYWDLRPALFLPTFQNPIGAACCVIVQSLKLYLAKRSNEILVYITLFERKEPFIFFIFSPSFLT